MSNPAPLPPSRWLESHGAILLAGLGLALFGLTQAPLGAQTTPPVTPPTNTVLIQQRPGTPVYGTSDSNNQMIAVTGVDLTGASILYLVDTQNRQLAVYQANGGSDSTQSVKLVGARRIDLDLKLYGFNDKSEYSFEELERRFGAQPSPAAPR